MRAGIAKFSISQNWKKKKEPSHSPVVVPNTQEDDRSRLSADTAFWSFFGCEVQTETGHHRFQPVSTVREGLKEGKPTDCRVGELRTADYKERSSPSQNAIALALALALSLSLSPSCLSGSCCGLRFSLFFLLDFTGIESVKWRQSKYLVFYFCSCYLVFGSSFVTDRLTCSWYRL